MNYTKPQLKNEIKRSIKECKNAIKAHKEMLDFFGDLLDDKAVALLEETNKNNEKFLSFCYECLGKVEAGELDEKLAKDHEYIEEFSLEA